MRSAEIDDRQRVPRRVAPERREREHHRERQRDADHNLPEDPLVWPRVPRAARGIPGTATETATAPGQPADDDRLEQPSATVSTA